MEKSNLTNWLLSSVNIKLLQTFDALAEKKLTAKTKIWMDMIYCKSEWLPDF